MKLIKCIELCISGESVIQLTDIAEQLFPYNRQYDCLTSSSRYLGQKKYSELLKLLYNGCTLLLQHEQVCNTSCRLYPRQSYKYAIKQSTFRVMSYSAVSSIIYKFFF